MTFRPDNRQPAVVWYYFEADMARPGYPSVSWALGSDWGVGMRSMTEAEYREIARKRMTAIYGPKP